MLVLAIDTATSVCSVALARDGKMLAEITTDFPRKHSQRLLPMVENLVAEAGLKPTDIELLAVTRGPGSFTGLRIGIATIKGMGLALGLQVVGLSTLEVLAHNFHQGLVCPVLNARLNQVYGALYRTGQGLPKGIIPQQAIAVADLLAQLATYSEPIWFCGDGAEEVYAEAQKKLTAPRLAPAHLRVNRAGALADLALYGQAESPDNLAPLYLRESQAEIQLRKRVGK